MEEELSKKRRIRSFVVRAGRMTALQQRAYDELWPQFGLQQQQGLLDLEQVFGRSAPLVFEIGFGMGQSLAEMAANEPDKNFIGVEVHRPGVGKLLSLIEEKQLSNIRVFEADAVEVLRDNIPDATISRFQLYFPDPWHKKRHHKRRLVQPAFMTLLSQKLSADGLVHMATDWEHYAEHMMEVLTLADDLVNTSGEYAFAERPEWRPVTKFERRGERLGHGVWDLLFQKD